MIRVAGCNVPTMTYFLEGLEFRPNGNSYRRKRQEKAYKYLKRGNALVPHNAPRLAYTEITFSPESFIRDLLDKHQTIFRELRHENAFILIGAKEFSEIIRSERSEFGFNFNAPLQVGYREESRPTGVPFLDQRSHYRIYDIKVVVSPRVSGILVLDKNDFRGL